MTEQSPNADHWVVLTPEERGLAERAAVADDAATQLYSSLRGVVEPLTPSPIWGLLEGRQLRDQRHALLVSAALSSACTFNTFNSHPSTWIQDRDAIHSLANRIRNLFNGELASVEQSSGPNRITVFDETMKVGFYEEEAPIVKSLLSIELELLRLKSKDPLVRLAGDEPGYKRKMLINNFLSSGMYAYTDAEDGSQCEKAGVSPLDFYAAATILKECADVQGLQDKYPPFRNWLMPIVENMMKQAQQQNPYVEAEFAATYCNTVRLDLPG